MSSKIAYLLSGLPESYIQSYKYDNTALFSITKYTHAVKIANILYKKIKIPSDAIILDACACTGGNILGFIKYYKNIVAVENSKRRYVCLKHNINNINWVKTNIDIVYASCLDVIKNSTYYDVIFFDPPWGGVSYLNEKNIELYLDNIPLCTILSDYKNKTSYYVLKLPSNYNFKNLIDYKFNIICKKKFFVNKDKTNYWVLIIIKNK